MADNRVQVIGEIEGEVPVVQSSADPQILYAKTIEGGLLGLRNCLRVSMLFSGCILVQECIPCTGFDFPDDVLGIDDTLPVDLSVVDSFSGYGMEPRTVYDPDAGQYFTVDFNGNHRSSWGGYVGEDDEIYMLVRDAGEGQWYNFFNNYYLQCVLLHFTPGGSREELDPIPSLSGRLSYPGPVGHSDEHSYTLGPYGQLYFSIPEWLAGASDYEHLFDSSPATTWLKSGGNYYAAGDARIGGTRCTVRLFDYAAGAYAGPQPGTLLPASVESVDLRTINPSHPATSCIVYSLSASATGNVWAFVGHMAIAMDRDTLDVVDYIDMGDLVAAPSTRPIMAHVVTDDLLFVLQTGTGTYAQFWRWRRDIGFDPVGTSSIEVNPAELNRGFGAGFVGSETFLLYKGFIYLSCNGWAGYSVDIVKIGQLICPPTYAPE